MRLNVQIDMSGAAFDGDFSREFTRCLEQAAHKAIYQMTRVPATHCTHPEAEDKILDSNGNTVGYVQVSEPTPPVDVQLVSNECQKEGCGFPYTVKMLIQWDGMSLSRRVCPKCGFPFVERTS